MILYLRNPPKHSCSPVYGHYVRAVVNLIGTTTTQTGLHVRSQLITKHYPTDQKVSDLNMQAINLDRHAILPAWNYTIAPRQNRN